jgi:hypothetical protein
LKELLASVISSFCIHCLPLFNFYQSKTKK